MALKFPWSKKSTSAAPAINGRRHFTVKRVGAAPESTQLKDDQFSVLYDQGRAIEPPLDPLLLTMLTESSEMHSAALDAKAIDAAGRGFKLVAREGVDDPDKAEAAAVKERLKFICPDYPVTELLYQAAIEMEGIGWSGWEVIRDADNRIAAIYPLPGHTLRATKDPDIWVQVRDHRVRYYKRFGSVGFEMNRITGERTVAGDESERAAEVIVFRQYSSRSSYYGIPRWLSALPSLSELAAIRQFNTSYFESSGVLDKLILIMSNEDTDEAAQQIEGLMKDAQNQKHGAIVADMPADAKVQIVELAQYIKEGKGPFKDQRQDLNRAVLIAHKVPPYRVGWAEGGALGGNAARDMLTAYRYGSVEPLQTNIEYRLAATLFGPAGFNLQGFDFSFNDLDWQETELSLKLASEGTLKGILTHNEGRALLGRDPADDPALDKHYFNGKVLDSSEDAMHTVDILKDLRTQFDRLMSEEQETALNAATMAVAGDNNAEQAPMPGALPDPGF